MPKALRYGLVIVVVAVVLYLVARNLDSYIRDFFCTMGPPTVSTEEQGTSLEINFQTTY